ncbi:hypothetical protein D3C76_336700 [compost metagenome]
MKVKSENEPGVVADVVCDMCGVSARGQAGHLQYGTMRAAWGEGSAHDGEVYELHLCESCFFAQVSAMKRERWLGVFLEEEGDSILRNDTYGLVRKFEASDDASEQPDIPD